MNQFTLLPKLDNRLHDHVVAATFTVDAKGTADTLVILAQDSEGFQVKVPVPGQSAYAHITRQLTHKPVWELSRFLDESRALREGLYIKMLKEEQLIVGQRQAQGIIILINGKEPGEGTIPLHDYPVKPGDVITLVYKVAKS